MKVKIPNPCSEKHDIMSPTDLGRMCKVCNTEVVDFTNWESKDIVDYIQKSNQKVCGRLKAIQMEKERINAQKWKNWIRICASVLFIAGWDQITANTVSQNNNIKYSKINTVADSVTLQFLDSDKAPLIGVNLFNSTTNQ